MPPATRRGTDRLAEIARRRALDADAVRPAVILPAILAVLIVAAVQWWLYTGGTWTVHPALTIDSANQADALLHYPQSLPGNPQPLLHGIGAAVLLMPFQWALHRGWLDQPISDQCVLLIFVWGLAALVARWLCRLHVYSAPDSPISFIVAGTILGSLAVPWPSVMIHPDATATAIATAAFFFISGLYIVWSNRVAPSSHLAPLVLAGGCWLLAALASPMLVPAIVLMALLASPAALPRRAYAPIALFAMLAPLAALALPALRPASPADWSAMAIANVLPNFHHFLALPMASNWRAVLTKLPHLRSGAELDPSVLLWQSPLLAGALFAIWGLVRTRPRRQMPASASAPDPVEIVPDPSVLEEKRRHDPDHILITPREPTGASLSYTLAIDSPLPADRPDRPTRITPHPFTPAASASGESADADPVHRISPAVPVVPPVTRSTGPSAGPVWLPVTLAAAWICTTFVALMLPAPSALSFSLTTQAAALLLVVTWWPFVARHKTRPAFRFSMSVALALALLALCAGYFSITFIPA